MIRARVVPPKTFVDGQPAGTGIRKGGLRTRCRFVQSESAQKKEREGTSGKRPGSNPGPRPIDSIPGLQVPSRLPVDRLGHGPGARASRSTSTKALTRLGCPGSGRPRGGEASSLANRAGPSSPSPRPASGLSRVSNLNRPSGTTATSVRSGTQRFRARAGSPARTLGSRRQ